MRSPLPLIGALLLGSCQTVPTTAEDRAALRAECDAALAAFRARDSSLDAFFDNAAGWAVLPEIAKGGAGIGGAYGRGMVYVDGEPIGYCDMTQGSYGFQLGGQIYRELIFFEDEARLASFRAGTLELSAQASAVALEAGAAATTDYRQGMAVFTMTTRGLMYEATIAGQTFDFVPLDAVPDPPDS